MWIKDYIFFKKLIFQHRSQRHITCSFDSLIDFFLVSGQNFFTQSPKKIQKPIFSRKVLFFEMLLWKLKKQFWQNRRNVSGKGWFFCSKCEHVSKTEQFRTKPVVCYSLFVNMKKNKKSGKVLFFETILWKNRMHIWGPRKSSRKKAANS